MFKQDGYTLVELMVVVALIGILSALTVKWIPDVIKPKSLVLEVDVISSNLMKLLVNAKSTQSSALLSCGDQYVLADYYTGVRSNTSIVSTDNNVGLAVSAQIEGKVKSTQYLLGEKSEIAVECPSSCGNIYVSSDGYILSDEGCNSFDFIFSKKTSPEVQVKLSLSNLGFPRLYIRSTSSGDAWNELLR